MSRSLRLGLVALSAFLLFLPIAIGKPGLPPNLKADESAYYLMAQSLAYDADLRLEAIDVERAFASFPFQPIRNLIVMSDDGWATTFYAKPLPYPLLAAPFVRLGGANGMLFCNLLLTVAMLWMGTLFLRRYNPEGVAAVFAVGFFLCSAGFAYAFWLQSEVFNMAMLCGACFLVLYRPERTRFGGVWLSAATSGCLLALAAYNKPMYALVGLPLLAALWLRRQRIAAATWLAAAAAVGGLTCLLALGLSGHISPYLGAQLRTGVTLCGPDELPFEPPASAGGAAPSQAAAAEASPTGNTWSWLFAVPYFHLPEALENLGYFLWGRHTGFLLYFPFAALAVVFFLFTARTPEPADRVSRWLLLGVFAALALYFLVYVPVNWQGGGGFIGNRYIVSLVPTLLFLVRRIPAPWTLVAPFASSGLLLGPLLLTPFGAGVPEPTLQAHVRGGAFRAFPLELSLKHLPGYYKERQGGLRVTARRDQAVPRDGGWWIRGADRVDLWIESSRLLDSPVFLVSSPVGGNRVELRLAGAAQSETLGGDVAERFVLEPQGPDRTVWRYREPVYVYRLAVQTERGSPRTWVRELPPARCAAFDLGSSYRDSFFLGATVALLGEREVLERDVFALEWGSVEVPGAVPAGARFRVGTTVTNRSSAPWPVNGGAAVSLAYHWRDASGRMLVRDGLRTPLPEEIAPGEAVTVAQRVEAPADPGDYVLEIDLVFEHVAWFAERTGETIRRAVLVRPSGAASEAPR